MGILNARRFVALQTAAPTQKEIESAETLTAIGSIIEANTNIEKYVFNRSKDLEKGLSDAGFISVHYWVEMNSNGKAVQRAELVKTNGNTARCRLYGTDKELLKEDTKPLANFVCGFCKSGDELVTDLQSANGRLQNVPRIYVNISEGRS